MSSTNANYNSVSCQLGGLTFNGNVTQGTAQSLNVITINDPTAAQTLSKTITGKFLQVTISGVVYYLPLYQ
jgi:hypothetical protein